MIRFDDWEKEIAERAAAEGSADTERSGRARRSSRPRRAPVPLPTLVLAIVAVFIVFVIASGTIWAFAKTGRRPASRSLMASGVAHSAPSSVPAASGGSGNGAGKLADFGDIGLLRAATADKKIVTIVVQPYLSYPPSDVPFQEELVQKTRTIRAYILNWFHSKTIKEIDRLGEANVKSALLDGVNGMLVLGKVSAIYFSEYMVIE